MEFLATTDMYNGPHLLTGTQQPAQHRFRSVVGWACYAEGLGFDAVGVEQRHAAPFLSSAPAVVLSHIAAKTGHVRLLAITSATRPVDPVRAAEDYATLDHLSGGRIELVLDSAAGEVLTFQSIRPVPLQEPSIPLWHALSAGKSDRRPGGESGTEPADRAAQAGGRIFCRASQQPLESYATPVDNYRRHFHQEGRAPESAVVGAAVAGLYVTRTSQDALGTFRPYYSTLLQTAAAGSSLPYATLTESIEHGPVLVGSPQQVLEKIHRQHDALGHQVLGIPIEGIGIPEPQQKSSLELFFSDVVPALRRELPSVLWERPRPHAYAMTRKASAAATIPHQWTRQGGS